MGLSLTVGLLADLNAHDEDGAAWFRRSFEEANASLKRAGATGWAEPEVLAREQIWSCDLLGYGGLHTVRRLAAYKATRGVNPPPATADYDPVQDAVAHAFFQQHSQSLFPGPGGFLRRLFGKTPEQPPFAHLTVHGDADGLYVPIDFRSVVKALDFNETGATIGSAHQLLAECCELAAWIGMPDDLDPEGDTLLDLIDFDEEHEGLTGWQIYAREAHTLAALITGCRKSIQAGAALVFC